MIKFVDSFGRQTIIEILPSTYNNRASLIIRKERQTIYESLEVKSLEQIRDNICDVIIKLEKNNDKEI